MVCVSFLILFVLTRQLIKQISQRKAIHRLSTLLFPLGSAQQEETMKNIEHLTHSRFNREDILDYFLKIKGLQTINLNDPVDFWTRQYLMQPTRIRLNYFEQVKFYEIFLNYPEIQGKQELIAVKAQSRANMASVEEFA